MADLLQGRQRRLGVSHFPNPGGPGLTFDQARAALVPGCPSPKVGLARSQYQSPASRYFVPENRRAFFPLPAWPAWRRNDSRDKKLRRMTKNAAHFRDGKAARWSSGPDIGQTGSRPRAFASLRRCGVGLAFLGEASASLEKLALCERQRACVVQPLACARGIPFAAFAGPLDLLTRCAGRSSPRRAWARSAAAFGPQIDPLDRFARLCRSGLTPCRTAASWSPSR